MPRRLFLVSLMLGAILWLCSCQFLPSSTKAPAPKQPPVPESPLTYLYFDEYGMYFEHVQGCEFCAEDGRYTAYFYIANEVTPYPVEVDQAWVDTLTAIIAEYNMMAWNGFTKRDSRLLDGTSFRTEFSFADGTHVQASGYGAFPSGYAGASAAIDAHFMQLLPEDMHDW